MCIRDRNKFEAIEQENPDAGEQISRIGLILTSRDDPENESVEAVFQELADRLGAELSVQTPDVSATEAAEARELAYHTFALCDVNPIEYQMLAVNELVAENVDVIAIHANHEDVYKRQLPDEVLGEKFYELSDNGYERQIKERFRKIKGNE